MDSIFVFIPSFHQIGLLEKKSKKDENEKIIPESVNYHFTRQCNYSCGFCFHTAKTSFVLPLEEAKLGLRMLVEAGMKKVNFSGSHKCHKSFFCFVFFVFFYAFLKFDRAQKAKKLFL